MLRARSWQPIKTVPKDRTPVLVYSKIGDMEYLTTARFCKYQYSGTGIEVPYKLCVSGPRDDNSEVGDWFKPTHWMLLPNPPEDDKA